MNCFNPVCDLRRFSLKLLFLSSVVVVPLARAGSLPVDSWSDAPIQLVQSVPVETNLAQPGLPMTADVWIEMIKGAKSTIDLAQFYLSSQHKPAHEKKPPEERPLEPVIEELERAAKRGVRIRLLLSSSLLKEDPETLARFKRIRGINIRSYNMAHVTGGVHHAKYWIVDGRELFIGSQNFDWRSLTQIHELGVRVQDPNLAHQLGRIFEVDWKIAKTDEIPPPSTPSILLNPFALKKIELVASPEVLNPGDTRSSIQALIEIINEAKRVIRVQILDYSPVSGSQVYWGDLDNALRAAALRGVKVQMLVSSGNSTTRAIDYLKSLTMIPGVEIKMTTIPMYSGGPIPFARVIHSKYMVVDDEIFWIGTSNWSKGYFYNSRNVELIFHRPELAQIGNQIFQRLWNYVYSEKIDPNRVYQLPH